MKKSRIIQKKFVTICGAMLIAIILVIVYVPQAYLAALLPVQKLVNKTEDNSVQNKIVENKVHKSEKNQANEVESAENDIHEVSQEEPTSTEELIKETAVKTTVLPKKEEKPTVPLKDDANHQYNEMLIKHDIEGYKRNGRDMSNDPEYRAQLREIYSEEDLKRMFAPRRVVTLPNVEGKTVADAVKIMHAAGITPRVAYEDGGAGKKEGTVIRQELPGDGRKWNTDASIFIYVQRSNKPVNTAPVKNVTEPTTKPTVSTPKPQPSQTKPSVETPKTTEPQPKPSDDAAKSVEPTTKPAESNELPKETSNPEVPNNDTTQPSDESL
ncbi:PASTA domain-containing protein [Psychrobacillus sp. NPDC093180]|uniref:PASTA domain-containing protein n=1 Tax=Psychrobacillus sp. NPDC093180 TaxID=3364489 RepID=UPI0037FBD445